MRGCYIFIKIFCRLVSIGNSFCCFPQIMFTNVLYGYFFCLIEANNVQKLYELFQNFHFWFLLLCFTKFFHKLSPNFCRKEFFELVQFGVIAFDNLTLTTFKKKCFKFSCFWVTAYKKSYACIHWPFSLKFLVVKS